MVLGAPSLAMEWPAGTVNGMRFSVYSSLAWNERDVRKGVCFEVDSSAETADQGRSG